jgi:LPXTG-site transpeptidase (sortase) family protein
MNRREAVRFVVVRSLGNFLVLFSLYGVAATFGPALYFELQYRVAEARGVHFEVQNTDLKAQVYNNVSKDTEVVKKVSGPGFLDVLAGSREQVLIAPDTDFSILIPKIGASAKVYPNIDPGDEGGAMSVLRKGIAHAKGSVFPGMQGNIYLFAHSADNWWDAGRYNAVFYLLKDLSPGDEIVVFFEGRRYNYIVSDHFIADPTYMGLLNQESRSGEQLVLQTCWPPGTAWKRLFVVAKPKLI